MPELSLSQRLEAVLFVASEPLSLSRLAAATSASPDATKQALEELEQALRGGIRLSRLGDDYCLVTVPDAASTIRQFLQDESKTELTRPALETLAIVAYRGPITKTGIEQIRGVASETMIRNLLGRGLIMEAGRSPEPGRPTLYAVTHAFLRHFGLTNAADLPPIPEAPHAD